MKYLMLKGKESLKRIRGPYHIINEYYLQLIKLHTVNNNYLPLIKILTGSRIIYH